MIDLSIYVVKVISQHFTDRKFETLRDVTWDDLEAVKAEVSAEDYKRAHFVLGEKDRVLAVCEALEKGNYNVVGQKMYETHEGLSKEYEVSCEELDYLNDLAKENGVTGSRIMGGGFGGCIVALAPHDKVEAVRKIIADNYEKQTGLKEDFYVCTASQGVSLC